MLADVSGSTRLYEEFGDVGAHGKVSACVARIAEEVAAHGGEVVHSRGDDLLCVFETPQAALDVARHLPAIAAEGGVLVHSGLHWGKVLRSTDDAHGSAVNVTARLASKANAGETLLSDDFLDRLGPAAEAPIQAIGSLYLKGRAAPLAVHALISPDPSMLTRPIAVQPVAAQAQAGPRTVARFVFGGRSYEVAEGQALLIGRDPKCQMVIEQHWISRVHAEINVSEGLVEFTDRSSTGSYLTVEGLKEVFLRRRTVALSGKGAISLGMPLDACELAPIRFALSWE